MGAYEPCPSEWDDYAWRSDPRRAFGAIMKTFLAAGLGLAALLAASTSSFAAEKLLNASYDIARELFVAVNKAYVDKHPGATIDQSHAGSAKQARAIVEGLEADVVTFNQVPDVAFLAKNGLVSENWQNAFANKS